MFKGVSDIYSNLKKGFIKVSGLGKVKITPNLITVQIGILTRNKSALEAQQENAAKTAQVITALNNINIDNSNIQTISYVVQPYYRTIENEQILEGFEVLHQLEVTITDLKHAGIVLDTAFLSGANLVQNLVYKVSDEAKYYNKALTLAIKDAVNKAQNIAKTIRIPLHQAPIEVTELSSMIPFQARREVYLAAAPSTPIMVRDIEIEARIEAKFVTFPFGY